MATNIFPGVYTTIVDESQYVQELPGVVGFMALMAEKGPDNTPVMISSTSELISVFGQPNPRFYGQGWYVALQYLTVGGSMYIMRVLPNYSSEEGAAASAAYANTSLTWNAGTSKYEITSETNQYSTTVMAATLESVGGPDVIFYAVGRGNFYNSLGIRLTEATDPYLTEASIYSIDVYDILSDSTESLVESFRISFDEDATDYSGESLFVEHVLEKYSTRIRAKCKSFTEAELARDFDYPYTRALEDGEGEYDNWGILENGTDGGLWTTYGSAIDGTVATNLLVQAYSGLLSKPDGTTNSDILDSEIYTMNILFDAGYAHEVKSAIMVLADTRGDSFAFLDNSTTSSPSTSAQDAITNKTGNHHYDNPWQGAVFEPYTKIYDSYTGKYIWMTPVYHVARAFAKTERDYNLWWPFAGLTRGLVNGVKELKYRLFGEYYKAQFKLNQINPIIRFHSGQDAIWGNWTVQNKPSALQSIHVALTVLYIKRVLEYNLKFFVFELNDYYTWNQIKGAVTDFLADLQSKRALEWFSVSVSASDYDKKLNRCQVKVDLQVTGAIEVIEITLAVHQSGTE